jgi:hypothetical protein
MRILFLGLILIAGFSGVVFAADIEFTISLEKPEITEYKTQDPVKLIFKLKNTGSSSIYINKRFFLGPEESSAADREVYLSVISPSAQKLPYKFPYKTGLPKSDYFVLLKPGEEALSENPRNINGTFEFSETGEYKITAAYKNIYGAEIGIDAFKGQVSSNTITVKIIK